jgi:putative SOS response-associated peptidase YedK
MLAILKLAGYERWLGTKPDPRGLLIPFPSEPMTIWPISRRVNSRSIVRGLQAFSYERILAWRALKRRAYPV